MEHRFFEHSVVYQIYPRSFCDSNGDGIGDIPGIISKLDYLSELGVGILWLSPVYRSPNTDYGYDVSDYYDINPEFGTLKDMDRLIAEARKRGIRIVMDLVVNHTSDEHAWFRDSIRPDSPYRDFYYWRKGRRNNKKPPNNWESNFGGSAWSYVPEADAWYLHLFAKKQPDLDWHNPRVLEEVEKILRFWLDRGVYGFRCDVINQIWKENLEDGKKSLWITGKEHYLHKDGCHQILKKLHDDVYSHYDCMTVGETGFVSLEQGKRFLEGELDMFFQFDVMNCDKFLVPAFKKRYRPKTLKAIYRKWMEGVSWNANFLENHDQIRSLARFGDTGKYRNESAKMLATLLMGLRGTPFVYQGQEIGMVDPAPFKPEDYVDPVNHYVYGRLRKLGFSAKKAIGCVANMNRDNARIPVSWDDSLSGGFSTSEKTWLPVHELYKSINAKAEDEDPDSILNYYRRIIHLHNEDEVLCYGDFKMIETSGNVFAFERNCEGKKRLVLLNLSKKKAALPKALQKQRGEVLISNYPGAGYCFKKHLRPYESLIVSL